MSFVTQKQGTQHPALPDIAAVVALMVLVIAFFWRMAFTNQIFVNGDAFTYFYPYWAYRGEAILAGQIPLWNPYLFMGTPFLANSQAGVLYPPNWPLAWLSVPNAIKVAIIGHVLWAALGAYVFGRRSLRLDALAALFGASIFALSGYLTSQVEHVNQLQGLAWLPWLFWLWHRSLHDERKAMLLLGLAFGLQLLAGHTQSAFISGVGLGSWALWHAVTMWYRRRRETSLDDLPTTLSPRFWRRAAWPVVAVGIGALLALLVAAVQVLPTFDLTQLSNRGGGLPFLEAVSFSLHPFLTGKALLPGYATPGVFSEYVAYCGIPALMLGLYGAWQRRHSTRVLGLALVAGLGLFLAWGAYNPVYWVLLRIMPGFSLFRAPARWLALFAFGTAMLAGVGMAGVRRRAGQRQAFALIALPVLAVIVMAEASLLSPLSDTGVGSDAIPTLTEALAWATVMGLTLALLWWIASGRRGAQATAPALLAALGVVELFLASRGLPYNELSAPQAWTTQRPTINTLLTQTADDLAPPRVLSLSDTLFDPGDSAEIEAVYGPYLTDETLLDLLIAFKQQEILAPNLPLAWHIPSMDGFDGGVLPTRAFSDYTSLFLPNGESGPDGRLREYLDSVPDLAWLRGASVGWIITDKVADAWIDDVYYDLTFPIALNGESDVAVGQLQAPLEATAIGVVVEPADGVTFSEEQTIATVNVLAEGREQTLSVPLHASADDGPAFARWDEPLAVTGIVVHSPDSNITVRGISVIDTRTGAFLPAALSADGQVQLIHSGDVKIYADGGAWPRAMLTCGPERATDDAEALALLAENPLQMVIVSNDTTRPTCNSDAPREATITEYAPERVAVNVVVGPGTGTMLVLNDAWYPGWTATVDGEPTEIYKARGLFRAVSVPPGEHEVIFTYHSQPFVIGAIISGAALLGIVAGLILPWRHLRRR